MGWWTDNVVPRVVNHTLGSAEVGALRQRTCAGLRGSVLEIGFGSGLNVAHYPAEVEEVQAVEPSDVGWRLAQPRIAESTVTIRRVGPDGAQIALPEASVDHALATFTLCTIPDVSAALREVARVMRPGGTFHFLEHGRAADPSVRRWQDRLDRINAMVDGGCHLNRAIADLVTAAGMPITSVEHDHLPGPKAFVYLTRGVAVRT